MAEIIFTGNAGADGVLKFTPSGSAVYELRVADTKSKKLDNGDWEEVSTQWFNVAVWGKLAEHLAELNITKGTRVKVAGEFYVREFEHNGQTRQSLDVKAWGVDVFQRRGGSGGGAPRQQTRQQPAGDPWATSRPSGGQVDPWHAAAVSEPPF